MLRQNPRPAPSPVRVVFLGNCADYSPEFLAALSRRSRDPSDRVTLVAAVCPMRFASRPRELWFSTKRRIGRVAASVPASVTQRVGIPTWGVWQGIDQAALRASAEMLWPHTTSDPELCRRIAALEADVAIVAGLDRILKEPALAAFPPLFNIHPSLLPEFRGATPEFWQLDAGLSEGGVTLHRIEAGIDTGPIILQRRFPIEPWLDATGFLSRSVSVGIELMNEFLDAYPTISERAVPQHGGSSQPTATAQDRLAPFARPANEVFNRARAAGFSAPLVIYVSRSDWRQGRATRALGVTELVAGDTLALELYEPVPFSAYTKGSPGELSCVEGGAVALTCNPGTVLFRRVEPRARAPEARGRWERANERPT